MGVVLEVTDRELQRTVAVKLLYSATEPEVNPGSREQSSPTLARFLEESLVTAQLDHPGIAPVFERGFDDAGRAYFTMRVVRGRELGEIFDAARSGADGWNLARAVGVLVKVCQAVAYAHSKGVIHRDLKPSNVMVGEFGEVYVMDWGVAKVVGRPLATASSFAEGAASASNVVSPRSARVDLVAVEVCEKGSLPDSSEVFRTLEGSVVGTPVYMPPEQARGRLEEVDHRSDLYAIGAVLYRLLTGTAPYASPGSRPASAVLERVRREAPQPIRSLSRDAPLELVAICKKAMARDKAARYGSCLDLAEDLQSWLDGRVVGAYRTGPIAELIAWTRRNRATALSGMFALALAVAGLAGMYFLERNAKGRIAAEKDIADEARTTADGGHAEADAARVEAERAVVDLFVTTGLAADERLHRAEAALWFASAALRSPPESHVRWANRLRAKLWSRTIAVPVRAFRSRHPAEEITFDPSGRYLLCRMGPSSQMFDVEREAWSDGCRWKLTPLGVRTERRSSPERRPAPDSSPFRSSSLSST
jgi:hypothetical protein